MCNCMVLDVTAIFFWITAFLKKLPFLAKGLIQVTFLIVPLATIIPHARPQTTVPLATIKQHLFH